MGKGKGGGGGGQEVSFIAQNMNKNFTKNKIRTVKIRHNVYSLPIFYLIIPLECYVHSIIVLQVNSTNNVKHSRFIKYV